MEKLIFVLIGLGLIAFTQTVQAADEPGHIDCPTPVLEYTTGYAEEDRYLYSPGVEWVVTDVLADPRDPGWIVLVHLVAQGDAELETLELHPEGLAQVQVDGAWTLQRDFEETLCLHGAQDFAFRF